MPPERFIKVSLAGRYHIDLKEWNDMLDRYYKLHGWDSEGKPTKEVLIELGLNDVAKKLKEKYPDLY